MKTSPYRIGVFCRDTLPTDGGADVLLRALRAKLGSWQESRTVEIVQIPTSAWSHRRQPARYVWWRLARMCGLHFPLLDFRPVCRQLHIDLVYLTMPIYARISRPYIFTLWDLGHRSLPDFPEMNTQQELWIEREATCREMLTRASFVVTGNNRGAIEAQNLYGLMGDRVVAIPFPNPDFSEVAEALPAWAPRRPFFIYPAQSWAHKNHFTLLRAIALLRAVGRQPFDLVFVGSDKGNLAFLKAAARELGVADCVHFGGFVTRGELKALYLASTGLVFPSLLGPNNLPPQEAAVLGCPIILSDLPGHREQLRDGAIYVDPLDAEAWGEAMVRLTGDAVARADLVERARQAVADYTIENYAARLGKLFARMQTTHGLGGNTR